MIIWGYGKVTRNRIGGVFKKNVNIVMWIQYGSCVKGQLGLLYFSYQLYLTKQYIVLNALFVAVTQKLQKNGFL